MFSWFCCNQNLLKSWCGLWARLWKKLPKTCCRDLQVGILENWYHKKKKKNWFGKNFKNNSANCDFRFHTISKLRGPEYYYLELLEIMHAMARQKFIQRNVTRVMKINIWKLKMTLMNISDALNHLLLFNMMSWLIFLIFINLKAKMKVTMVNPDLIDFNAVSSGDSNHNSVPSATIESLLLPPEEFYFMCCQLDDAQKQLFSFIMWLMKSETTSKNKVKEP